MLGQIGSTGVAAVGATPAWAGGQQAPRAYDNKALIVAIDALLAGSGHANVALARKLLKELT